MAWATADRAGASCCLAARWVVIPGTARAVKRGAHDGGAVEASAFQGMGAPQHKATGPAVRTRDVKEHLRAGLLHIKRWCHHTITSAVHGWRCCGHASCRRSTRCAARCDEQERQQGRRRAASMAGRGRAHDGGSPRAERLRLGAELRRAKALAPSAVKCLALVGRCSPAGKPELGRLRPRGRRQPTRAGRSGCARATR